MRSTATNGHGAGTETLTLAVTAPTPSRPRLTAAATASGTVGLPFTYRITATNSPTHYFATSPGDQGNGAAGIEPSGRSDL